MQPYSEHIQLANSDNSARVENSIRKNQMEPICLEVCISYCIMSRSFAGISEGYAHAN